MRLLFKNALAVILLLAYSASSASADFMVSISDIVVNSGGGQFDVKLTSTGTHSIDSFGIRLNATAFIGSVAPITITSETSLLPGFAYDSGTDASLYSGNSVAAVNGGTFPGVDTFGTAAGKTILGSPFAFTPGSMANIARFTFTTNGAFDGSKAWDVGIVTTSQDFDTSFVLAGAPVNYSVVGGTGANAATNPLSTRISGFAAVPEPSSFVLCGLVGAGIVGYRLRRKLAKVR